MTNPLVKLGSLGQSPWLDFITRDLLTSGELQKMIEQDGLRGMTTNPTIFDSIALFHASHANLTSTAFGTDDTQFLVHRLAMSQQTEAGSNERIGMTPEVRDTVDRRWEEYGLDVPAASNGGISQALRQKVRR